MEFEVPRYIKISVWYIKQLNSWGESDSPRKANKILGKTARKLVTVIYPGGETRRTTTFRKQLVSG